MKGPEFGLSEDIYVCCQHRHVFSLAQINAASYAVCLQQNSLCDMQLPQGILLKQANYLSKQRIPGPECTLLLQRTPRWSIPLRPTCAQLHRIIRGWCCQEYIAAMWPSGTYMQ